MDIEVDEQIYLPKSNDSIASSVFGSKKVSFVMLLIIVVGVYVAIFMILNNVNTSNNVGASYVVLLIEVILWLVLIYVVYINIKKYNDDNVSFQAKLEDLFNTKISELTINADTKKNDEDEDEDDKECKNEDDGKEVFHIANNDFNYNEARDMCE